MTVTVKGVQVELTPVESSNIAGVGFNIDGGMSVGMLVVQFMSGAVYAYRGVPLTVHAAFMAAKSKGKYLQAHIASSSGYPYECVQPVRIFK